MATIRVTATITYVYDLDGGLVSTEAEALDDARETLATGQVPVDAYEYTVTTQED